MPIKAARLNSLILIKETKYEKEDFMDVAELPVGGVFNAGLLC